MTVRRDYFNGQTALDMFEAGDYRRSMLEREYAPDDITDTCLCLMAIYQYAAYMGGYELDISDYQSEVWVLAVIPNWRKYIANCVADCYVFGIAPEEHVGLLLDMPQYAIRATVDVDEFVDAAVDGGLIEMLDAWLAGVPLEHIVPTEWLMGFRHVLFV